MRRFWRPHPEVRGRPSSPPRPALLRDLGYTLIIDETLGMVDEYEKLTAGNRKLLEDNGIIDYDPDGTILWNDDAAKGYITGKKQDRFRDIRALCLNGSLVRVADTFIVWRFPA